MQDLLIDGLIYAALALSSMGGFALGMWITILIGDWITKQR